VAAHDQAIDVADKIRIEASALRVGEIRGQAAIQQPKFHHVARREAAKAAAIGAVQQHIQAFPAFGPPGDECLLAHSRRFPSRRVAASVG
jgi:hypothetical protein